MTAGSDLAALVDRRARTQQQPLPRFAHVATVDATNARASVLLPDGTAITGVTWLTGDLPQVGTTVLILRASAGWIILGEPAADLNLDPGVTPVTTTVLPTATRVGLQSGAVGGDQWVWWAAIRWTATGYSTLLTQKPRTADGQGSVSAVWWPAAAGVLPSGSTLLTASLQIDRAAMATSLAGGPLVSPRLDGLAPTMAVPGAEGTTTAALATVAGYADWTPGTLAFGQLGSWALPSAWLSAWLAGQIGGIALATPNAAEVGAFGSQAPSAGALTLTYLPGAGT